MACSCAFLDRCFLAFSTAWKQSSCLCIWLFSCSRRASMLVCSFLGNSADRALGTHNPCHRQYTSNWHIFLYSSDHGCSTMVNSVVVVFVLNCAALLTMMCPTLPRLSYLYIGILTKFLFFPTHFPPKWFVYVCSCCSAGTCYDAFVEVDPNLFRTVGFELKALWLVA